MKRITIFICLVSVLTLFNSIMADEDTSLTKVPEELVKKAVIVNLLKSFPEYRDETFDVILVPVYTLDGELVYYIPNAYYGEEPTPTLNEILYDIEKDARTYYTTCLDENIEYKDRPHKSLEKIYSKKYLNIFRILPYYEQAPIPSSSGGGLHKYIPAYWLARIGIEKKFPNSEITFIGFRVLDGYFHVVYEFDVGGERYLVDANWYGEEIKGIHHIDDIDNYYTFDKKENTILNTFKMWENIEENTIDEILEEHDMRQQESNIEMEEIIKKMIEDKGK